MFGSFCSRLWENEPLVFRLIWSCVFLRWLWTCCNSVILYFFFDNLVLISCLLVLILHLFFVVVCLFVCACALIPFSCFCLCVSFSVSLWWFYICSVSLFSSLCLFGHFTLLFLYSYGVYLLSLRSLLPLCAYFMSVNWVLYLKY